MWHLQSRVFLERGGGPPSSLPPFLCGGTTAAPTSSPESETPGDTADPEEIALLAGLASAPAAAEVRTPPPSDDMPIVSGTQAKARTGRSYAYVKQSRTTEDISTR